MKFLFALFLSGGGVRRDSSTCCCLRMDAHKNIEQPQHYDDDTDLAQESKSNAEFLSMTRRDLIVASMAGLTAEAAWRQAVDTAAQAASSDMILPKEALQQLKSGRAVVIPNWLSPDHVNELRADCSDCFEKGHFSNFVYSKDNSKGGENHDPAFMPSFFPRQANKDGPFVDSQIGNLQARLEIKALMAEVKAALSKEFASDRPTLANDIAQTHELEYIRYDAGGFLKRHVDERHLELKRPGGARLPLKPNATRRSITWLVYLNENDWEASSDGGQLRVYERQEASAGDVGAQGRDLQIGWLHNDAGGDEPVFLDAVAPNGDGALVDKETCKLYTTTSSGSDRRRYLSEKPFVNAALYLAGGEKLMMDDAADTKRFRFILAPKSIMSSFMADGSDSTTTTTPGERVRDIVPAAGTLVMFDSVSLPHQVLQTNRERFGVQGWFHETLYPFVEGGTTA